MSMLIKIAEDHPQYDVAKIYMDAYPQESTPGGERYPDAQVAVDRQVQEWCAHCELHRPRGGARLVT